MSVKQQDRASRIRKISHAIETHAISSADLLSLAVQSSARKVISGHSASKLNYARSPFISALVTEKENCDTVQLSSVATNLFNHSSVGSMSPPTPEDSKETSIGEGILRQIQSDSEASMSESRVELYDDDVDEEMGQLSHPYECETASPVEERHSRPLTPLTSKAMLRQSLEAHFLDSLLTWDEVKLQTLCGIGRVRARRIVEWREENESLLSDDCSLAVEQLLGAAGMRRSEIVRCVRNNLSALLQT